MRRLLPLIFSLLACGTQELPPGEGIGTFAFVATLDETDPPADEPARCRFAGAPARIEFDGAFSHELDTGVAWLLIDGTLREGTLRGAAFELGLAPEADGSIRGVPRRLAACSCDLLFVESLAGRLVRSAAQGCSDEAPIDEPIGPGTCPRVGDDGQLSWDTCGGVCGVLREEVRFDDGASCTCEVDGAPQAVPDRCQFSWRLQATRIGS